MVKQSRILVKPSTPTPQTFRHYKIGFTDEFAPVVDVSVVLFFPVNGDDIAKFDAQLEKSLARTLSRFYPLAGRYVEEIQTVDCNDQGAEFVHAKVNIKLQDFLDSIGNVKLVDDFIPSKTVAAYQVTDPLFSAQVTLFECGGVAIGVSIAHKIADASTLSTFLIEWAARSREENEVALTGFNSSSLFPARGLPSLGLGLPPSTTDDVVSMYVTIKFSLTDNMISMLKEKLALRGRNETPKWSKGQLASALMLKGFIGVDRALHGYQRECILLQPINVREKFASLIPSDSCGNLWGLLTTECGIAETTEELADNLRDSIKKTINNYSEVHHDTEEGQALVLNSFIQLANIPLMTNVIWLSSWCNFPFYDADFGFGKPIWASCGTLPVKNLAYLMDDVGGNGVEAYVCLEAKDVPHFEEALDMHQTFRSRNSTYFS
ncbi:hypothetical protein L1887_24611 [Cichorium endivia]|nr:hypothetical protein L1887_24611 [Cichorium endivia]